MLCTPPNWRGLLVVAAALALVLAIAPFVTPVTMDEARRIASNKPELPELLNPARQ
jgi:hypothetical protein